MSPSVTDADVTLMSTGPRSDTSVQTTVAINGTPMKTAVRNFRECLNKSLTAIPLLKAQTATSQTRFARAKSNLRNAQRSRPRVGFTYAPIRSNTSNVIGTVTAAAEEVCEEVLSDRGMSLTKS